MMKVLPLADADSESLVPRLWYRYMLVASITIAFALGPLVRSMELRVHPSGKGACPTLATRRSRSRRDSGQKVSHKITTSSQHRAANAKIGRRPSLSVGRLDDKRLCRPTATCGPRVTRALTIDDHPLRC
jgi:hypothetical protein